MRSHASGGFGEGLGGEGLGGGWGGELGGTWGRLGGGGLGEVGGGWGGSGRWFGGGLGVATPSKIRGIGRHGFWLAWFPSPMGTKNSGIHWTLAKVTKITCAARGKIRKVARGYLLQGRARHGRGTKTRRSRLGSPVRGFGSPPNQSH